jgi:hypothetical protein
MGFSVDIRPLPADSRRINAMALVRRQELDAALLVPSPTFR